MSPRIAPGTEPGLLSRRTFLSRLAQAAGGATLLSGAVPLLGAHDGLAVPPTLPVKAKQVIYLHMVGGPSQLDLFDHKPGLGAWYDKDLPESIRNGQRLTSMTATQTRFPIAPSLYRFDQHGACGMWLSELLPALGTHADDICWIRSMHTDAINHDPAISQMQTGNMNPGRPCLGAWVSYAMGSLNAKLPSFVVLTPASTTRDQFQVISGRLWSSGFLPGEFSGVPFRSQGDPILFIASPPGVDAEVDRARLDAVRGLDAIAFERFKDPQTRIRSSQYEMALRMEESVPELSDLGHEPASTWALYGDQARTSGTFTNSALMARRLIERGVRFVQIYHNCWDHHAHLTAMLPTQCRDIDGACHALITDLKQRGLLESTLIIWGGEFGRTVYSQGGLTKDSYGRDHHPRCFTMWMAGGGAKAGVIHGETDDFSYNIVKDPVHVRDFHATVLRLLGYDHERLTYRYQGLDARLTGTEHASVIPALIA